MQWLVVILDVVAMTGIAWWLYRIQSVHLKIYYWPALLCKVGAGVALGLLYFYYYGQGDTISYWHDGKLIAEKVISDPSGAAGFFMNGTADDIPGLRSETPRSLFFVKISGLLALISAGNYWMMSAMLSLASFVGAWYLFTRISRLFPGARLSAAVAFLFYPSVVFWSSGLIKESVGLGALLFLTGLLLAVIRLERIDWWEWALALIALWLGWTLKYYWVGVFMPVAITTLVVTIVIRSKPWTGKYELSMWAVLFVILLLIATSVHPNFYPHRFVEVIATSNAEFMTLTRPENAIHYYHLKPAFSSIFLNAPWAFAAGLFRPLVWEFHNLPSFAAGVENLLLLALVLASLPSLGLMLTGRLRLFVVASLVYIVMLAVFLALATPNLGTLSRYKIGFLPFLVFLILQSNVVRSWMRKLRLGEDFD